MVIDLKENSLGMMLKMKKKVFEIVFDPRIFSYIVFLKEFIIHTRFTVAICCFCASAKI